MSADNYAFASTSSRQVFLLFGRLLAANVLENTELSLANSYSRSCCRLKKSIAV